MHDQPTTINDGRRSSATSASRTLYSGPEAEVGSPPCRHRLSFHPFVRSAPSFRPDLHTARAVAHSGGQGWPVFGPPRQRRAASLTVASTAARLVASGCLAGTHQTWRKKRAHVQLKKLAHAHAHADRRQQSASHALHCQASGCNSTMRRGARSICWRATR